MIKAIIEFSVAQRWLVLSLSDREPPAYAVFERATGKVTMIGTSHPDVPASATGPRRAPS